MLLFKICTAALAQLASALSFYEACSAVGFEPLAHMLLLIVEPLALT